MKKRIIIVSIILVIAVILAIIIIKISKPKANEFDRLRVDRESIVTLIKDGKLEVKANGLVVLPEKYKKLSDSGECVIFNYFDKTAIYFWTYRGIIDSSKGYFYVTDEINYQDYINTEVYSSSIDFTKVKELDENWYFATTG